MPAAPKRASARAGGPATAVLRVTAVATLVIAAGVAANVSPLRTPNDGVYYVAAARALVDTGTHVDATIVPYGLPITRQNGIVYVLAAMMAVAGDAWPVVYTLVVAMLWAMAVVVMARFYGELHGRAGPGLWPRHSAWALAAFTCFQYDLLNDSTSFMNEGIYVPVFFAVAAETGRRLIGATSRAEVTAALGGMSRGASFAGLVFVLVGLFFRNQHAVLLPLAAVAGLPTGPRRAHTAGPAPPRAAGSARRRYRLVTLAAPFAAVAAFAAYAAWLPAPVTDGYFATLATADSIERSDVTYALAMFTGPLSLTKVMPYDHPLTIVAALVMALATVAGLRRMWQRHPFLSAALALYIAGTAVFLVMLPFVSTRYYALVNLPLIAALSMLLPAREASARWLAVPVAVAAIVVALYVRSYLSGEKREQAYPQLVAHQRAAALVGEALIYSSQPRMVWWVLGTPACGGPPDECAAARGLEPGRAVVFIGREDESDGQDGLRGYRTVRPLAAPVRGYAAWVMEVVSSGGTPGLTPPSGRQ